MLLRTLLATGVALLLTGPAMANDCTQDLDMVNEVLAKPKEIKFVEADMGADAMLEAVGLFVKKAVADQKAGKEKACVTRLAAAKKILNID